MLVSIIYCNNYFVCVDSCVMCFTVFWGDTIICLLYVLKIYWTAKMNTDRTKFYSKCIDIYMYRWEQRFKDGNKDSKMGTNMETKKQRWEQRFSCILVHLPIKLLLLKQIYSKYHTLSKTCCMTARILSPNIKFSTAISCSSLKLFRVQCALKYLLSSAFYSCTLQPLLQFDHCLCL